MVGNFRVPNAGTQVSAAPTGVTGNVSSKKRRRNSQANSQLQPLSNTNIENSSSLNSQPPDNIFIGNPFEDPHSMRMPPNSQPQALPQSDHGMSGGMMPSSNSPMRNSPSFSPFHNNGNGQMIEGGGGPPISMDRMPHPNMSSVPISSALPSDPSNRMINVNGNVPHSNPGVSPNFFNPSMNNMCDPMSGMIPGGVPMNVGGGGGSQMNPNGPSPMMLMNRGMPPYMNNHNHPDGMNSGGPLPPPPHPQMFGNGPLPPVNNGPGMSPMSGEGGVPNNGNGNGNFPPNSSNMSQMGGNPQMNGPMPPSRFMDQVDNLGSNSPSHHPASMIGGGGPFGGNGMGGPMMRSSGSLHDRMMMGGGGPINNNRAQQLPPYCEQPGAGSIRPSHAVSPSMNVMNNGHNSPLNPGMSPSQHNPPPGGPMPCPMPMSSPGLQNHVMMGPNGPRPCSSPMTQHEMQNIPNGSSSPYTNNMAPTPPSGMMMMPGGIPNHANSPSHRPSGPPHPSPHMVGPGPGSGSPHGGNIGNTAPLGPHSGPHPNPTVPCGPHSGNNGPASCPPGNPRHIPPDMSPSHCGGGGGGGGGLMPPNSLSPMPTDHTGRPLAFPPGMCPPPGMMHPHHPLSNEKVYPIGQPMVFNPQNPNAPPIYPCGICHREVHDNDQAILCESGCNFWFHRICTGLSQSAFHFLTQEIYAEWVCDKCFTQKDIPLVKFKP